MRVRTIRDNNWSLYRQTDDQVPPNAGFITRKPNQELIDQKKQGFYTTAKRDKKRPYVKFKAPEQFYCPESKSDESIYLEDVIFKDIVVKNGKRIYKGEKLFFNNNITDQFFPEDDKNLMTKIGVCRAYLLDIKKDLEDDGILNNSVHDSICEKTLGGRVCKKKDMLLTQKSFQDLEDWHGDDFKDALEAFLRSCELFNKKDGVVKSDYLYIASYAEMRPLCKLALVYKNKIAKDCFTRNGSSFTGSNNNATDTDEDRCQNRQGFAKIFFERYFSPFKITDLSKNSGSEVDKEQLEGLFTGYYLWELEVSRYPNNKYRYPIYQKPKNKEDFNLSRKAINSGALMHENATAFWGTNLYDINAAQIQGSAIGYTPDGNTIRLGYDGKNNHKFRSYSEKIKNEPDIFANQCKKYSDIPECLKKEPELCLYAINHNDSYVFFKELTGEDIIGSQGVPLTQSRSIAIDPLYHPYGMLYYIETSVALFEDEEGGKKDEKKQSSRWLDFNRLFVSQDTGSAIKGMVRADLYFGHGFKGEYLAKNQKFPGLMYILIPNFALDKVCPNT